MIKLQTHLSQDQYTEAIRLQTAARRNYAPYYAGCFLAALGMFGLFHPEVTAIPFAILIILLGLASPIRMILRAPRQIRAAWAAYERIASQGEMEFSPDHIRVIYPLWNSTYRWEMFTGLREGPRVFVLEISQRSALIVPRQSFVSPEQLDEFHQLLRARISSGGAGGFPVLPIGEKVSPTKGGL